LHICRPVAMFERLRRILALAAVAPHVAVDDTGDDIGLAVTVMPPTPSTTCRAAPPQPGAHDLLWRFQGGMQRSDQELRRQTVG
jgi:hypothetical protein